MFQTIISKRICCALPLCLLSPLTLGGEVAFAQAAKAQTISDSGALLGGAPLTVGAAPVTIAPDNGAWDLSRRDSLIFKVRNTGGQPVTVWARAENAEAKGVTDNVRTATVLAPGKVAEMRLRLMRRPENPTYAPFKPFLMYFKDLNVRDNTLDPAQVARVVVWIDHPTEGQRVSVESVTAQGKGTPGPVPFLPFIDKYGQYKHADWPDKIYSDADFAAVKKKDAAEMAAYPGPSDWDQWGGWKSGPKQKATGFFYPIKLDGKWWLVTPGGSLFWSYGATGVGSGGEGSPVTDKEKWFEELPSPTGPAAKYWGEGQGARFMYYQDGKAWKSFSFSGLNAERKYGPKWREATADSIHSRLRNWGLNTIANWSDPVVYLKDKTPYVVAVGSAPLSLDHFPDVFDPAFTTSVNANMDAQKGTTANDPWNIGYFVDNELTWGSGARASRVTQGVLRAAPTSASKIQYVQDLKAKYNDIAALNTAWGTQHASWDALLEARTLPEKQTDAFKQDAGDFGAKIAEKYFSTVRDAVKRVAPNNLYLGCRFHGYIDTSVVQIAAKYVDVIGYNCYEEPNARLNQYRGAVDKPFIIGEFGVTSDLGQTPWRGAVYTQDQGERLTGMEKWLNQAFTHPALVGAHFFQFRDQPLSGRGDGEATLRGFLNVADTPHFDLVQLNRRVAYELYARRSGQPKAQAKAMEDEPKVTWTAAAAKPARDGAPATLAGRSFLSVPGKEWKLKWNDEFEGNTLDQSKWTIGLPWGGTDGTGRHHNDQYASYIMDDDIAVRGGSLHLTTQKRDVTDKNGNVFKYTEGLITTNKTFQTRYGYFEIRAKMPTEAGAGTWPAFWTLSDGWPPEFDIIEYWGSDNRIHQGTVTSKVDGGQRWDSYHRSQVSMSGWHTYGLEWGPGYQHYNIDGVITNSIYGDHLEDGKSHYLLLNSGVDARRPPLAGTVFPNDFEVQYVRVYDRPDVPALLNGDFEKADAAPWSRSGEGAVVDYGERSGSRVLRLDVGAGKPASFSQKVFGLAPNTRYRLSAWARTQGNAKARLEVKDGEVTSASKDGTGLSKFGPLSVEFTTGDKTNSVTVACSASDDGAVFFDDVSMERIGG